MPRILVLAAEPPPFEGELSAGPGMRAAGIAQAARAAGIEITLASPSSAPGADAHWRGTDLSELLAGHDAVIVPQGLADVGRDVVRRARADLPVVVDCYAPALVERLALEPEDPRFGGFLGNFNSLLKRGDLFLVANSAQRSYVLGLLSATGRINPRTAHALPVLEAPFGVPESDPPPVLSRVARGVLVPEDAAVVLWFGAVYPWFDAVTAVRGFAQMADRRGDARLLIVGGRDPRGSAPDSGLEAALRAARDLDVAERVIEVPWVPFERRVDWYAEADCAVSLSRPGLESELAHRTRLIDLVWGRVPVIGTQGDTVSELIARAGAGKVIAIGAADALGAALTTLLDDSECRSVMRSAAGDLAKELTWPKVLAPLTDWLADPEVAADRFGAMRWGSAAGALVRAAVRRD